MSEPGLEKVRRMSHQAEKRDRETSNMERTYHHYVEASKPACMVAIIYPGYNLSIIAFHDFQMHTTISIIGAQCKAA